MRSTASGCSDLSEEIHLLAMGAPKRTSPPQESFGARLRRLRKVRGFSQTELGQLVRVSQRMMTYYEREAERPPAHLLPRLAEALKVSVDELLGLQPIKETPLPRSSRLLRKLRQIEKLPRRDQQALLRTIDAFLSKAQ